MRSHVIRCIRITMIRLLLEFRISAFFIEEATKRLIQIELHICKRETVCFFEPWTAGQFFILCRRELKILAKVLPGIDFVRQHAIIKPANCTECLCKVSFLRRRKSPKTELISNAVLCFRCMLCPSERHGNYL